MSKESKNHLREVSELQGELNQLRYEVSSTDSASSKTKTICSTQNSRERSLSKGQKVSPRTHKLNDPSRLCGPISTDSQSLTDAISQRGLGSNKNDKSPVSSSIKENTVKKPPIKPNGKLTIQNGLPNRERNENKSDPKDFDSMYSRNDYSVLDNTLDSHISPRVSPISKITIEKRIFNKLQGKNVGEERTKKLEHSPSVKSVFSQCLSKANIFNFISSNSQAVNSYTNSTPNLLDEKKGPSELTFLISDNVAKSQEYTPISISKLRRGTLSGKENDPISSDSQKKIKPMIYSVHSGAEFNKNLMHGNTADGKDNSKQTHPRSQPSLKIRLDFKEEVLESCNINSTAAQRDVRTNTDQRINYAIRERDRNISRHTRIESEGLETSVTRQIQQGEEDGTIKSKASTREVSARIRAKSSDRRDVLEPESKFANVGELRSVQNESETTFTSGDYIKTSPRDRSVPREEADRKLSENRGLNSEEIQQLRSTNIKNAALIDRLKSQNANQEKEIEFLKRCKARLEKNLEEMADMTSKEYIIKIKKLENGLEERENQAKELSTKFEKSACELQKLTQKYKEEQRVHEEMMKSMREKISQLEAESKSFQQSKKEYALIENKIQELEEMQNRLLDENSTLKIQSGELREQNQVLRAQREHENKRKAEQKKNISHGPNIALHMLQSAHKLRDINGFTGKLLEIVKTAVKGQEPPIELLLKHNRNFQAPKFSEKEQELAAKNMEQLIQETANTLDKVHTSFHTCMDTLCDLYAEKYSLDCFIQ